jgi:hypothetical protein
MPQTRLARGLVHTARKVMPMRVHPITTKSVRMVEGDIAGTMFALRRHIEAGWATVNDLRQTSGSPN